MNFGRISTAPCINVPAPRDARCDDPAFALANPGICPLEPTLIIKPSVALACALGSIQFKAFYVNGNVETDVTALSVFQSSDPNTAVVGAISGNATGLTAGGATISATYLGITALADLTILGDNCCDDRSTAMLLLIDNSKSMGQAFNGGYSTKLVYAKAAAARFISEINEAKDLIGVGQFNAAGNDIFPVTLNNKASAAASAAAIVQSSQLTTFTEALTAAIAALNATSADTKMLVILSDFEDTDTSYIDGTNPIAVASDFKTSGGIILSFGVRAHDAGYALGSAFSTGGFFINAYDATADSALDYLSGLKGYVCAGNCTPTGDEFKATGSLNYCSFEKWRVIDGHVDLIGNGFMDLLPGNGLYVDLSGSRSSYKGTMVTRDSIAIESGKQYRLSMKLAGNQRVDASPNSVRAKVFSRNNDGLDNPTNPPSVVLETPGGDPIDPETHEYAYSYANANGETELSPSASIVTNNSGDFIHIEADANPLATIVRLYRKFNNRWYLIAESDPTAPAFDDTRDNAGLSASIAAGEVNPCEQPADENTTGTPVLLLDQIVTINNFQQDFQTASFTFTAPGDADVYISIQQTETPSGYDATGLLLDSVKFVNATDLVTLFEDDFDGENMQYVPPACGIGTNYVLIDDTTYGYMSGYNCYGEGCLSEPPAAQSVDPNPLPDIEQGFVPPTVYTSTQTRCGACAAGFINLGPNLVPVMTSATAPSGVASADTEQVNNPAWKAFDGSNTTWLATDNTVPVWLQYKFAAVKTVRAYGIRSGKGSREAKAFELQGSNDGSTWDTLDSRENVIWAGFQTKRWMVATPASYLYYRLNITELTDLVTGGTQEAHVAELELFEVPQTAPCSTETAESEVSQGAADSAALAAATLAANAQLNCNQVFTVTETFTAKCPVGTYGAQVTKSSTVTSLISQSEAEQEALANATEAAEAELDCTQSNNDQQIVINDRTSGATGPASASPYPTVKHVTGLTGLVTKVTVQLNGLTHSFTDDIHMLLLAPDGVTYVELIANCGGNNSITGVNLVLDDAAGSSLPDSTAIVSGTFKPTQFGVTGPNFYPTPAPQGAPLTTLAGFIGIDGNGSWSLWICDDQNGGSGTLDSWDLTITSA